MAANDIAQIRQWISDVAPGARLSSDSRRIRRGDVFFAYPGEAGDGRAFIAGAIEQGAAAVVYEERGFAWDDAWQVPHLALADLKQQAGPIAHAFHGMPDGAMFSVGVTGTNGKTSCAIWLGQAFARLGEAAVVIGTLGVGLFKGRAGAQFVETGNTTPDAMLLAQKIAEQHHAGRHAARPKNCRGARCERHFARD